MDRLEHGLAFIAHDHKAAGKGLSIGLADGEHLVWAIDLSGWSKDSIQIQ